VAGFEFARAAVAHVRKWHEPDLTPAPAADHFALRPAGRGFDLIDFP